MKHSVALVALLGVFAAGAVTAPSETLGTHIDVIHHQRTPETAYYAAALPLLEKRESHIRSLSQDGRASHESLDRIRIMLLAVKRKLGQIDEKAFHAAFDPLRVTLAGKIDALATEGRWTDAETVEAKLWLEWVGQGLDMVPVWPDK